MTGHSKYRATPVVIDGTRFASKAEGNRYALLKLREKAREIHSLILQPKYPILIEGIKICTVIADFAYYDILLDRPVIEDVKGFDTPMGKLKRKLAETLYNIKIEIVKNR